jgi:hypothetical protein
MVDMMCRVFGIHFKVGGKPSFAMAPCSAMIDSKKPICANLLSYILTLTA